MKKPGTYRILPFTAILVFPMFFGNCQSKNESHFQGIIPQPMEMEYIGNYLELDSILGYVPAPGIPGPLEKYVIESLASQGIQLLMQSSPISSSPALIIDIDSSKKSLLGPEGYELTIDKKNIHILAARENGIFYGFQSLMQILWQDKHQLPCMKITDSPRFSWRGMHLDVSRHFMPVPFIKEYIDYLAFLKMNTFHWHLVDDQGWRIEIKKYPRLTEIGGWRDSTLVGHYSDRPRKYDGKRYGGFYTQDEIREIVRYAADRYINIVPEIEMPGHSQAAIAAYPEFGCSNDKVGVWTKWGVSPYIYNVDDKTFTFLEDVLTEVMDLFPSYYIHIGGDEALKKQWKSSPAVQKKMKELHLTDEEKLQGYFVNRIQKFVHEQGREIIGWDEIVDGDISTNAAVMSWRGTEEGFHAASLGHKVVMTPISYCYFDHYQSKNPGEPLAIGDYLPLDSIYFYEAVPPSMPADEKRLILGVQGNMWTEYMPDPEQVEYMLFPRIFAMSEIQWSANENKDFNNFLSRLQVMQPYLDGKQINYAKHYFGAGNVKPSDP